MDQGVCKSDPFGHSQQIDFVRLLDGLPMRNGIGLVDEHEGVIHGQVIPKTCTLCLSVISTRRS